MRVLFGGDPEILLRRGNLVFPCVGLIPGTKREPFHVENSRCGLTIQEDGVALEIGFDPVPYWDFRNRIRMAWDESLRYVRTALGRDVAYSANCYHTFQPEDLISPQARTLGCDPDLLAYDGGNKRPPPTVQEIGNDRFVGGHIHVGFDRTQTPIPDTAIIQFMDLAYLNDVYEGRDRQGNRRKFYGLAGLYRKKSYGVEYRTPSNYWLLHHTGSASYIVEVAHAAITKPSFARSIWKQVPWELVQKSINEEQVCLNMSDVYNWLDMLLNAPIEIETEGFDDAEPTVGDFARIDELDTVDDIFEEEEAA